MRNYLSRYFFRFLQLVLGFAIASWTAHALGPAGRGDISSAQVAIGLSIALSSLGVPIAAAHFVSRHPARLAGIMGNSLAVCLATGACAAAALALFWIPRQHLEDLALPICAGVIVQLLYLLSQHFLLGLGDYKIFNSLEALTRTAWFAMLVAFSYSGSVFSVFIVLSAQQAAFGMGLVYALGRSLQRSAWQLQIDSQAARWMAPFSLKIYGSALAHDLLLAFDLLLVRGYRGNVEAGLYSSATLLGNVILQNCQIASPLLMRELSPLKDINARWRKARPVIFIGTGLSFLGALIIGGSGGIVLKTFFGEPFVAAWPSLLWILPGLVMLVCGQLCEIVLAASGHPPAQPILAIAVTAINIGLNLLVVPERGYLGAAQVATLTYGLWMVGTICCLAYYLHNPAGLAHYQESGKEGGPETSTNEIQ